MLETRMKIAAAVVAAGVTLLGATKPSRAQATGTIEQTTGPINLNVFKVGFVAGIRSGNGVLFYRGRRYRLGVRGAEIGSVGIAEVHLTGTVSNLRSPASISGTYTGSGAGAAFIGGGQVSTLQNRNGVVLRLRGVQVGLNASLSLARVTIRLL